MSATRPPLLPSGPSPAEESLRHELQRTYESLSEITSRLLLANEAADAALSTHDRVELCERLLEVAERGGSVRRGAVFLVEGESFSLGATRGLDAAEHAAAAAGETEVGICARALESGRAEMIDPDAVTADALAWAGGEEDSPTPGGEDETEDEGAEEAAAKEAGESVASKPAMFAVYLPVLLEDEPVAVLALGDRAQGRAYDRESLVFLQHLLRQFAVGLSRGRLIEKSEERLRELDALLRISREITLSLDLEAVLRGVVNTVGALIEVDRAEIALLRGGRLALRAVSGMTQPSPDQAEIFRLTSVLRYLEVHADRLQVESDQFESDQPPPAADIFSAYFSGQEMRSFMALPLRDDQGLLGFLCLETARDSWDLEPAEGDALDIVAAQTTVAIRNALLYSQIPLRGVARPMSQARARLDALSPTRRRNLIVLAIAALALALLPIFPVRVGGGAEVFPLRLRAARAPSDAVVVQVLVRGGEEVRQGQPLAVVEDLDLASRLAELDGAAELARRDAAAARRAGDLAAWREAQIRLAALERSRAFERRRARATRLEAPLAGQVLELNLPQQQGRHLVAGEAFCTVAGLDSMAVEFEVKEERIPQVRIGQPVALKVAAYPARTFRGLVAEVGFGGREQPRGGARYRVRAGFANPGHRLKPGMTGVARVTLGRSALAVQTLDPLARSLALQWW